MSRFERRFDVATLAAWDQSNPGNAVRALFDQWALPGENSTERRLRVGIRNGYLNLYAKGQSVAKLSINKSHGPTVRVHQAYASGTQKGQASKASTQAYRSFAAAELIKPETVNAARTWITTADTYASAEKRFVDDLIAVNPTVLDLEMGLPASDPPPAIRVAPRMDIVIAQTAGRGGPAIAFWEAKCANNPELRKRGTDHARVVGQVSTYKDWMRKPGRMQQVQEAYRATAQILIALHDLYRKGEASTPDCVVAWKSLVAAEPTVIEQPGIVIGNYWPKGSTEQVAHARMAQAANSFDLHKHREKLETAGLDLHEVGPSHKSHVLPVLPFANVSR